MKEKNVLCTVRAEGGHVVCSYMFPVGEGTITANTRMTPDEAEAYRFTLAALILQARGGVAPRKELVDRMSGRVRLIAAARLPAEPPSDDDPMRTEPMPMHEARALLDYIAKLEVLLRRFCQTLHERDPDHGADILGEVLEGAIALGLCPQGDPHGSPAVPDAKH